MGRIQRSDWNVFAWRWEKRCFRTMKKKMNKVEGDSNEAHNKATGGILKAVFWIFAVVGIAVTALLFVWLILGISIPPFDPVSKADPAELTLKAINIVVVFFSIVTAFLAFFGYKEVGQHQELRAKLEKQADALAKESKDRMNEIRYAEELNKAKIFLSLDVPDKASYILSEIEKPLSWEVHLVRAQVNIRMGAYSDALQNARKALSYELEPKEKARVYFAEGNVYTEMKEYDKANEYYDKCLDSAPDFLDAHVNKAYVYKRKDDLPSALKEINKAIALNDRDAQCYFNRACYYSLMGKKYNSDTEQDLKKAIQLDHSFVTNALTDDDLESNKDIVKNVLKI